MSKESDRKAFLAGYLEGVKYTSGPVQKGGYIMMAGKRMRITRMVSSISEMINDRTIEWLMKR